MKIEDIIKKLEYNTKRIEYLEIEHKYISDYEYKSGEIQIGVASRGFIKLEVTNADLLMLIRKEIVWLSNENRELREQLAKDYYDVDTFQYQKSDKSDGSMIVLVVSIVLFLLAMACL